VRGQRPRQAIVSTLVAALATIVTVPDAAADEGETRASIAGQVSQIRLDAFDATAEPIGFGGALSGVIGPPGGGNLPPFQGGEEPRWFWTYALPTTSGAPPDGDQK
jgi:hypothetical protein